MFILLGCADDATPEGAVEVNHPSFLCGQMNRHMGEEIVPPIPHSVFKLAQDDLVGTFGSAIKL